MIRTLFIIAGAGVVLAIACLAGATALGGADLRKHDWSWTFRDEDGDSVRIERARGERGPDVTRTLAWDGGESLQLDLGADVVFVQGPDAGVEVTGAKSVVDRVRVVDGRIYMVEGEERVTLGWRGGHLTGWSDRDDLRIRITAPDVVRFDVRGSQELLIQDYDKPSLSLDVSGSAEVRAEGRADRVDIDISGSGEADLADFRTRDATVSISGSGQAEVGPTGLADIDIAGSGEVRLTRRPTELRQDVSGSGNVRQD